jgi:hypothetical protein
MEFSVRNISKVPINYLFLQINDIMAESETNGNNYDEAVYQKMIHAFFPLDGRDQDIGSANMNESVHKQYTHIGILNPVRLEKYIQPGETLTLSLGIYGKKSWYACINEAQVGP